MKRKILPYKPYLKELARKLRNNSTHAEIRLWKELRGKFLGQYDFHRQKPIDNYILDFFCVELMLGIEVDGSSHDQEEVILKDTIKEQELNKLGIKVLRFTDRQVFTEMPNVLATIEFTINEILKISDEL
jgi:very-short-patch-repair endonuclease